MIIDSEKYNKLCECGKEHSMTTKLCVIEEGCIGKIDTYLKKYGLCGVSAAIYDENTYDAQGMIRPCADFEIVLPYENLHADNRGVALLKSKLPEKCDYLIAVGSGTICDLTRYCAYEMGIPFVSCPTAASVDGFCSSVAAMTWNGFKKTLTAAAPEIVIADLNIIANAPAFLTKSGFGDMIGKFIALADWKIANLLTGEYFCPFIYNMTVDAAKAVIDCAEGIKKGEKSAFEKLIYGLLMSGLAMQLLGNSRCASGAEHHISHLIEMQPQGLGVASSALHGEKVGVGTLLAAEEYHKLKNIKKWNDYTTANEEDIEKIFGERLKDSIIEENKNDACRGIKATQIEGKWAGICEIIDEIPLPQSLLKVYKVLDVKATLYDIGVGEEVKEKLLKYSPLVRNRLTLMRLRRAII